MESQKKGRIDITPQTALTLELMFNGAFGKDEKLSDSKAKKHSTLPYNFTFAPQDESSQELLKGAKKGDVIELAVKNRVVGEIKTDEVFKNTKELEKNSIFALDNKNKKLAKLAISGDIKIIDSQICIAKKKIEQLKNELNIQKITALFLSADPLNRIHERLIRLTIDKADLIIIFLVENSYENALNFDLKRETLEFFIKKFLPRNKIVVVPLPNTYLFTDHKNPELECIVAKNFGANKLVVGQNHAHIGLYYQHNQPYTLLDGYKNKLGIEILIMPEFLYCNECRTIVSSKTCPHGSHHQIKYNSNTLRELLNSGIIPPPILMRKEISAMILATLFPNRFANLQNICNNLFPNKGLLEYHSERKFYEELILLYQTTSLT